MVSSHSIIDNLLNSLSVLKYSQIILNNTSEFPVDQCQLKVGQMMPLCRKLKYKV